MSNFPEFSLRFPWLQILFPWFSIQAFILITASFIKCLLTLTWETFQIMLTSVRRFTSNNVDFIIQKIYSKQLLFWLNHYFQTMLILIKIFISNEGCHYFWISDFQLYCWKWYYFAAFEWLYWYFVHFKSHVNSSHIR